MIHVAGATLLCDGLVINKEISMLIREIDAKESETNYLISKIPLHHNWIDLEA